jgi:hypothetical protein
MLETQKATFDGFSFTKRSRTMSKTPFPPQLTLGPLLATAIVIRIEIFYRNR